MTLTASEYTFSQTFDSNSETDKVSIKYDAKVIITSTPANGYDSVSYSGISTDVDENSATYFTVPADNLNSCLDSACFHLSSRLCRLYGVLLYTQETPDIHILLPVPHHSFRHTMGWPW